MGAAPQAAIRGARPLTRAVCEEAQRLGLVRRTGFLLLRGFDLQAFAGCVEALALANAASGQCLYAWTVLGERSGVVRSRSGIALPVEETIGQDLAFDRIFVCSSAASVGTADGELVAWLRRLERHGVALGAIEGGAWLLARAGVAAERSLAVHWSIQAAFQESFPGRGFARDRYLLDQETSSAVGGLAAFEMMVERIRADHGDALAEQVSAAQATVLLPAMSSRPALGLAQRLGIRNRHLAACLEVMERHVESPLSNSQLAGRVRLSVRHLERLFRLHLSTTPARFYRTVRLEQARRLIQQTQMPVTEIAMATGFFSVSHFGRTFREAFGATPRRLRSQHSHAFRMESAQALL